MFPLLSCKGQTAWIRRYLLPGVAHSRYPRTMGLCSPSSSLVLPRAPESGPFPVAEGPARSALPAVSVCPHLCQRLSDLPLLLSLCFLWTLLHLFFSLGPSCLPLRLPVSVMSLLPRVSPPLASASLSISLPSHVLFPLGPLSPVHISTSSQGRDTCHSVCLCPSLCRVLARNTPVGPVVEGLLQTDFSHLRPGSLYLLLSLSPIPPLVALPPLPLMPSTPSPPSALIHTFPSPQVRFMETKKKKSHPFEEFYL